jgi:iron complex transport system permease protein
LSRYLTAKELFIKVAICVALLVVISTVCSLIGPQKISFSKAVSDIGADTDKSIDYKILFQIRLPRIILAAMVGAALACAGVTLQAILRNPLADPYILGISSGAALGVVVAIMCGASFSLWAGTSISLFAFIGALVTVWLVWFIGRFAGSTKVTSLLLGGVVVNAFFSAVIMFLTSIAKDQEIRTIAFWLMGNFKDEGTSILLISSISILVGIGVTFYISQKLNVLTLGHVEAKSLGVNAGMVRLIGFAASAFITAVAVSLTGLIGFVGLIVPHGVRIVIGPDHRQLLPVSALVGAIFLVVADTIARSIFPMGEQPVGVITAIAGGPFFLILLARYSRKVSLAK